MRSLASEIQRLDRVSPARLAAFEILLELRQSPQAHSDSLLHSKRVSALSDVDRNLTTALVMGVLRWEIALEQRVAVASAKGQSPALPVQIALELGAAQLLLLDRIPAHAAIFESVELVKQSGHAHAAGFANAVLRKIAASPKPDASSPTPHSVDVLARQWAHPEWMVERWSQVYGFDTAAAICRFDQGAPPVSVRLLASGAEEELAAQGVHLEAGAFVERARRVIQGDIPRTRAFTRGIVRIQDEASQLVAELAANAGYESSTPPRSILDGCAAPGGKTEILAERHPQAAIVACDIHPARLRAMRTRLSHGPHAEHISYRALDVATAQFNSKFDLALCDAPCSGTGTLARNPEIRHRLSAGGLARQQKRQIAIVANALQWLAPGGRLVYSTCSLEPEENEQVIEQALAAHPGFRLLPVAGSMKKLEEAGILRAGSTESLCRPGSPFLRTIPGIQSCDGFFAALIARED